MASFSYACGVSVSRWVSDRLGAGFGVVLGSMLGTFWGPRSFKKRLEKSCKNNLEQRHASHPRTCGKLGCGPLKETSQIGDWQLATGNWQDWGLADLFRLINTPLRALRGARWRIHFALVGGGRLATVPNFRSRIVYVQGGNAVQFSYILFWWEGGASLQCQTFALEFCMYKEEMLCIFC